jgi:sec-independent protein translocase protein TatB
MSGIGFWELIILFLIGLIVLGPERLPRVASQLGGWLGQARRMTRVMKRQLEDELDFEKQLRTKTPPPVKPQNQEDDTYSPAHEAGSAGTGVGDDDGHDDTTVASVAEESTDAPEDVAAPGEPGKVKAAKETP